MSQYTQQPMTHAPANPIASLESFKDSVVKEREKLIQSSLKFGYKLDESILGAMLQDCDRGQDFVSGDNCYGWYYAIGRVLNPRTIIETGVRYGYSAFSIMRGARRQNYEFEFYGIDDQRDGVRTLDTFRERMQWFGFSKVEVLEQDTQTIAEIPADKQNHFDVGHVDAWHTASGVYHECKLVLSAVKPGGLVIVDDCVLHGEVRSGTDRFCNDHGLKSVFLPSLRGTILFLKP